MSGEARVWCPCGCGESYIDVPASSSAGSVPAGRGDTELREQIARAAYAHDAAAVNSPVGWDDDLNGPGLLDLRETYRGMADALLAGPLQGLVRDHQAVERCRELADELADEAGKVRDIERSVASLRIYDALRPPLNAGRYPLEDVAREFGIDLDGGEQP